MISRSQTTDASILDELVDKICAMLQSGKPVDIDQLASQHPEMAQQLRKLFPTLLAINTFDATLSPIGSPNANDQTHEDQTLGDFRILRQIGRGGMGIVYEAQQLSISRKVALKILPLAALIDPRALRRFRNEVAAVATLEHPQIVPVYAVGEERGIHYFAMQLIRGQSLAAVISELRSRADQDQRLSGEAIHQAISDLEKQESKKQAAAQTGNDADGSDSQDVDDLDKTMAETEARIPSSTAGKFGDATYFCNIARLTQQAAEALQHAHDHGIVHRDVKPGNLLLDTQGKLFVTDFGLARIETGVGVTMTGDILGTLRYMSPEQVVANRMIVDHRTDVYSLGATLYELLTLQPLWTGNDKPEMIRQISFEEPVPPKRINPAIPVDLDTIVLKAISKTTAERYDSAQAFADDLQHYLEQKPILARRPTTVQRIAKWSRRNPSLVTSGFVVLLLATTALVASNVLIWRQKEIANQTTLEAQQQHDRAERNLDKALNAVEQILSRVADEQLMNAPGMEHLRKLIYDDALEISQSIIDDESDHPAAQRRLAAAYFSAGRINQQLGNLDAAEAAYNESINRWQIWLDTFPNHILRRDCSLRLAKCYANQRTLYMERGNVSKALEPGARGLQILEVLSRDASIESDRSLHLEIARELVQCGLFEREIGNAASGISSTEKAINGIRQLISVNGNDADLQIWLAFANGSLALCYQDLNNLPKMEGHLQTSLKILDEWVPRASDQVWAKTQRIETLRDLGRFYSQFQPKRAMPLMLRAVSEAKELCTQFPDMPNHHRLLGKAISYLAAVHENLGEFSEAKAAYELADHTYRATISLFPDLPEPRYSLASNLRSLANLVEKVGNPQEFEQIMVEATDLHEQLAVEFPAFPHYREALALAYESLATHYAFNQDLDKAETAARKGISAWEGLVSDFPENPYYEKMLADMHDCLGSVFLNGERYDAANEQYLQGAAIANSLRGKFPFEESYEELMVRIQTNLATSFCTLGQTENAEKTFLDSIEIVNQRAARYPNDPMCRINAARIHDNLVLLYKGDGQFRKAIQNAQIAVTIYSELDQDYPDNRELHARAGESRYRLASVLALNGDRLKALDFLDSAFESGYKCTVEQFQNDADFDNIRDQPRYRNWLTKLGETGITDSK